jgi:hypothetical protein
MAMVAILNFFQPPKRCHLFLQSFMKFDERNQKKIFKMATNMKIKKIVKNSKMNRFQWKWIFTGNKTCCTIWLPFWFAMVQSKHNMSPETLFGGHNKKRSKHNKI